jgi:methyl-accepting chemotaxis protein
MSFLARFRILTKILSVIAILSGIATLITVVGVNALSDLNDMTDRMDRVATNALVAQRASVNLIAMNRAEFRVAVDPGEQNRREARQQLDNEKRRSTTG